MSVPPVPTRPPVEQVSLCAQDKLGATLTSAMLQATRRESAPPLPPLPPGFAPPNNFSEIPGRLRSGSSTLVSPKPQRNWSNVPTEVRLDQQRQCITWLGLALLCAVNYTSSNRWHNPLKHRLRLIVFQILCRIEVHHLLLKQWRIILVP